jgi:inorganic pyrophosphatase
MRALDFQDVRESSLGWMAEFLMTIANLPTNSIQMTSIHRNPFNPDEHIFELKKVLPAGMTFPNNFGFVPLTEADDGDPVDVVGTDGDEPAFPGCVLSCRPIGRGRGCRRACGSVSP